MYLEHLESKISKYEGYIIRLKAEVPQFSSPEPIPSHHETQLRRQRLSLIRSNELLKRQLQEKDQQLQEKDRLLQQKGSQVKQARVRSESMEGGDWASRRSRAENIKSEVGLADGRGKVNGQHAKQADEN